MSLTSGDHPNLYKIGMKLAEINPYLFEYGYKALEKSQETIEGAKLMLGDPGHCDKISHVNLELTVVCNLRCWFCWWWGTNGIAFRLVKDRDPLVTEELSTQEIFKVVDQLAAKHMPSVYLSGGEPFLRNDTVDIIEYIAKKGMSVTTNNNGTLLNDEKLERLAKVKKLTINFSIDGPKDVHDKIRGNGNFDRTTGAVRKLIEFRGNSMFPEIKTNTTFSPWIAGRVDELIHQLQDDVNVDATRLTHLWFTDRKHADNHKAMLKSLFGTNELGVDSHVMGPHDPEYVKKLADEIMKIEKTRYKKPVFIHPRMSHDQIVKYYTDLNFVKQKSCNIGWDTMLIKANGDVMFCPDEWMNDFKIGSVRHNTVDELWNNDKARLFREALYKHKLFPACARCCVINF